MMPCLSLQRKVTPCAAGTAALSLTLRCNTIYSILDNWDVNI
jgi:hypothetical protein